MAEPGQGSAILDRLYWICCLGSAILDQSSWIGDPSQRMQYGRSKIIDLRWPIQDVVVIIVIIINIIFILI